MTNEDEWTDFDPEIERKSDAGHAIADEILRRFRSGGYKEAYQAFRNEDPELVNYAFSQILSKVPVNASVQVLEHLVVLRLKQMTETRRADDKNGIARSIVKLIQRHREQTEEYTVKGWKSASGSQKGSSRRKTSARFEHDKIRKEARDLKEKTGMPNSSIAAHLIRGKQTQLKKSTILRILKQKPDADDSVPSDWFD